jgi:spermidine synthase
LAVIPWTLIDSAKLPGQGELRLKRRGSEFSIMLGTIELMNSRLSGSEEALATLTCARLRDAPHPRILIGGLGMGFTLRAALQVLGPEARVELAELVPAVVAWAKGPMAEVFAGCLDDPRVSVTVTDVGAAIAAAPARYDAILLDVDNGPEGLTVPANDGLYSDTGLNAARHALRPGGVLAVWSQGPDRRFTQRLRQAGFSVEEKMVRAHKGRSGARHVIWLAARR